MSQGGIYCEFKKGESVASTVPRFTATYSGKYLTGLVRTCVWCRWKTKGEKALDGMRTIILFSLLCCGLSACNGKSQNGSQAAADAANSRNLTPVDILLHAAVVIGSCMPDDGINRNLARLQDPRWFPGMFGRFVEHAECIATTGNGCSAVEQCLGYSTELSNSTNCALCEGSVVNYCGDGVHTTFDCAKVGYNCDSNYGCVPESPATACVEGTYVPSCAANGQTTICDSGIVVPGPACAELSLECASGYCVGSGEACTEALTISINGIPNYLGLSCNGNNLRSCIDGRVDVRDCSALGNDYSCQTVDGQSFCGIDAECVPGEQPPATRGTPATCEGAVVVFCNAGHTERVDCRTLGFTGCSVGSGYFGCVTV